MRVCPKCGHPEIHGPTYCDRGYCQYRVGVDYEHLHYRCMRCHYTVGRPCLDAAPTSPPPGGLEEGKVPASPDQAAIETGDALGRTDATLKR